MLVLLRLTRSLYNTFAGAMTPSQIAYGLCLGLFLVMMPFKLTHAHTLGVLSLVLVTRASIGLFFLSAALFMPYMKFAGGEAHAWKLGRFALESESLKGFWTTVLNLPAIAIVDFDKYRVMGGFLLALLFSLVLFLPIRYAVIYFRTEIQAKADQYRIIRWWRGFFLNKALSYVFVGSKEN